ncbi:lytic murein transglycosylase [Mesorhizobium japonicum]|uniref:Lytic murein transglycosylase n=1 Tax=Mesorhizobium japonicum TaxID=2066070 RepID=A0A3M9X674_9HYPH|nr:lytic murein transglycosylase [Mesorhizobium japonicum]
MRTRTPLCPAWPPLKGGDWLLFLLSPIAAAPEFLPSVKSPISPPEGEMSGRTEGGA